MNKQDYEVMGEEHARNGSVRRYPSTDNSWQAQAYWRGVNSVTKGAEPTEAEEKVIDAPRSPGKSVVKFIGAQVAVRNSNWPAPVKEHGCRLIDDMMKEQSGPRYERLFKALKRMQKRHGTLAEVAP